MKGFDKVIKYNKNILNKLQTDISDRLEDHNKPLGLLKLVNLKRERKISVCHVDKGSIKKWTPVKSVHNKKEIINENSSVSLPKLS